MRRAHRRHRYRILPDEVVHDRDVVGRQVPHDVHVRLEQAEVDPHGIEVVEIADVARDDQLLHAPHRAREHERVIHREQQPLPCRQVAQLLRIREPCGDRLHHEHVLPLLERDLRQLVVHVRRSRDDDRIDVGRPQHLVSAVGDCGDVILAPQPSRALIAHVAHGFHLAQRMAHEVADQIRSPVATADDANTHPSHAHPLAAAPASTRCPNWTRRPGRS